MRKVLIVLMICLISFGIAQDSSLVQSRSQQNFEQVANKNLQIARDTLKKKANEVEEFYRAMLGDSVVNRKDIDGLYSLVHSFYEKKKDLNNQLSFFNRQVDIKIPKKYKDIHDWYYDISGPDNWGRYLGTEKMRNNNIRKQAIKDTSHDVRIESSPYWYGRVILGLFLSLVVGLVALFITHALFGKNCIWIIVVIVFFMLWLSI